MENTEPVAAKASPAAATRKIVAQIPDTSLNYAFALQHSSSEWPEAISPLFYFEPDGTATVRLDKRQVLTTNIYRLRDVRSGSYLTGAVTSDVTSGNSLLLGSSATRFDQTAKELQQFSLVQAWYDIGPVLQIMLPLYNEYRIGLFRAQYFSKIALQPDPTIDPLLYVMPFGERPRAFIPPNAD